MTFAAPSAVGLYAAALGAAKVTLTDHRPPLAATTDLIHGSDGDLDLPSGSSDRLLELLRANVARNAAPDPLDAIVEAEGMPPTDAKKGKHGRLLLFG